MMFRYYDGSGGWGGDGWGIFSMILMVAFWALIAVLVIGALRHLGRADSQRHYGPPAAPRDEALEVLKMRLAKGEINEEEYRSKVELLSGPRAGG
jgi:putative membrane protein